MAIEMAQIKHVQNNYTLEASMSSYVCRLQTNRAETLLGYKDDVPISSVVQLVNIIAISTSNALASIVSSS